MYDYTVESFTARCGRKLRNIFTKPWCLFLLSVLHQQRSQVQSIRIHVQNVEEVLEVNVYHYLCTSFSRVPFSMLHSLYQLNETLLKATSNVLSKNHKCNKYEM